MYRREAVRRLREHFRIHDDGRPTPYLDEAVEMACDALDKMDQILEKFGTFDRVMAAEEVVHCGECVRYNSEKHYCDRPCMGKIFCHPQYYCGAGLTRMWVERVAEEVDKFDREHILSAEEIKAALERSKEDAT